MDFIFIDTIINPLEVIMDFLKFSNIQNDTRIIILDIFNVITPEDAAELTSVSAKTPFSFEIFKPLEPDDIISFILSMKLENFCGRCILFVTDCPEIIPGKYIDYDSFFLIGVLKDIEEEKKIRVVLFFFVDDESQIEKVSDLFRPLLIIDNRFRYQRGHIPPFIRLSSYEPNPNVE